MTHPSIWRQWQTWYALELVHLPNTAACICLSLRLGDGMALIEPNSRCGIMQGDVPTDSSKIVWLALHTLLSAVAPARWGLWRGVRPIDFLFFNFLKMSQKAFKIKFSVGVGLGVFLTDWWIYILLSLYVTNGSDTTKIYVNPSQFSNFERVKP